jgi:hypothetical protein
MEPFVCFLNFVYVANFSILESQRSELTLSQSGAQRQDIFHWFNIGNNESSGSSKYGAAKSPGLGQCPSSKIFRQNNICLSAVVGSQSGATTRAAESLIAHLQSQGELTTPRREKSKNSIRKRNFLRKRAAP